MNAPLSAPIASPSVVSTATAATTGGNDVLIAALTSQINLMTSWLIASAPLHNRSRGDAVDVAPASSGATELVRYTLSSLSNRIIIVSLQFTHSVTP